MTRGARDAAATRPGGARPPRPRRRRRRPGVPLRRAARARRGRVRGAHRGRAVLQPRRWSTRRRRPTPRAPGLCELLAARALPHRPSRRGDRGCAAGPSRWRRAEGDLDGVGAGHRSLAVFEWYHGNRRRAEAHAAAAVEVLEAPDRAGHPRARSSGTRCSIQAFLAMQDERPGDAPASDARGPARSPTGSTDDAPRGPALGGRSVVADDVRATSPRGAGSSSTPERGWRRVEASTPPAPAASSISTSSSVGSTTAEKVLDRSLPLTVAARRPDLRTAWQLGVRARLHLLRGAWDEARHDAGDGARR